MLRALAFASFALATFTTLTLSPFALAASELGFCVVIICGWSLSAHFNLPFVCLLFFIVGKLHFIVARFLVMHVRCIGPFHRGSLVNVSS